MWCVDEISASRKNGPAVPQLSPPDAGPSGTPCAMPLIEKASTNVLPSLSFQPRRVCRPSFCWCDGVAARPWTSSHCRMLPSAFEGLTTASAVPCQIDLLGHGPRGGDAALMRSTSAGAETCLSVNIASNACWTVLADP